jgi:hypothetical protein
MPAPLSLEHQDKRRILINVDFFNGVHDDADFKNTSFLVTLHFSLLAAQSLITHVRAKESCHALFSLLHKTQSKPSTSGANRTSKSQRKKARR